MREKLKPWVAAIFCAALGVITIVANICVGVMTGTVTAGIDAVYYSFMPMCFWFVGESLSELRRENVALRTRVDDLAHELAAGKSAA